MYKENKEAFCYCFVKIIILNLELYINRREIFRTNKLLLNMSEIKYNIISISLHSSIKHSYLVN